MNHTSRVGFSARRLPETIFLCRNSKLFSAEVPVLRRLFIYLFLVMLHVQMHHVLLHFLEQKKVSWLPKLIWTWSVKFETFGHFEWQLGWTCTQMFWQMSHRKISNRKLSNNKKWKFSQFKIFEFFKIFQSLANQLQRKQLINSSSSPYVIFYESYNMTQPFPPCPYSSDNLLFVLSCLFHSLVLIKF